MRKNSVVRILNMRYTQRKDIESAFLMISLSADLALGGPVKGRRTAGMIARRFV
jgi:hypothetical protein